MGCLGKYPFIPEDTCRMTDDYLMTLTIARVHASGAYYCIKIIQYWPKASLLEMFLQIAGRS